MARLSISLLGPFQVTLDDKPVADFESKKVRVLLAYLAAEAAHPQARESLAEWLWPDQPAATALANLRHVLSSLRRTIGDHSAAPPYLRITPETLQFNTASNAVVDLNQFMALTDCAAAPSALAACRQAVALYRGPFLQGFAVDGSPALEEWIVLVREQLDRRMVHTLARLVGHCVQQADYAGAAAWTRRQVALEPWNEDAHRQLIWLLALDGQRATALHEYEICRRLLAEQLDVEPQAVTVDLVERIRAGQVDRAEMDNLEGKTLILPEVPPPPTMPPRFTPFFGRNAELAQIALHLEDTACRLLTLLGPGGVGKTRLAIEAAEHLARCFTDGAVFVDLSGLVQREFLADEILRSLAVSHAGSGVPLQQLQGYLRDKQMLLVLDNFEHLVDSANLLLALLDAAPQIKLLVTSRERLNLSAEWLFPLDGLAVPPTVAISDDLPIPCSAPKSSSPAPENYSAVQLFLHGMRRLQPGLILGPADGAIVVRICQLLDGIPLAIELASMWMRSLSLATVLARLERSLDLLATTMRDVPERHRSMHAVFDHSWRLLDDRQRSLLRQLSVFRGGCTLAAAAAVTGASPTDLENLVDQSWLRVHAHRFTLHELMRQYCDGKLGQEHEPETGEDAEGELLDVYRRHCTYFAGMTGAEEPTLNWQRESMALLTPDYGNLEAAWRWAIAHADFAATQQMMNSLYYFAEMTGWLGAMLPFFENAAVALRRRWEQTDSAASQRQAAALLLSNTLYIRSMLYLHLGWLTRAQNCLDEMRAVLAAAEHDARWQDQEFMARWVATCLVFARGDFAVVQTAAQMHLNYLQTTDLYCYPWRAEIGTRFWQAHMLTMLGNTAQLLGDYPAALAHYAQANTLREAMGEQRFKAGSLRGMAGVLRLTGAYEQALAAAHAALTLSKSFEDRLNAAYAELVVGQIETDAGRFALAAAHCERSLAVALESGEHGLLMRSLVELARIDLAFGHPCAARQRLDEAIAAFAQMGEPHSNHLAVVYTGLGQVACAERDWPQARQMLRQALTAPGRSAWETLAAIAAMAEVDWGEGDGVTAARLLAFVVGQPATAAHTRQHVNALLQRVCESIAVADGDIRHPAAPLLTLDAACQLALGRDSVDAQAEELKHLKRQ